MVKATVRFLFCPVWIAGRLKHLPPPLPSPPAPQAVPRQNRQGCHLVVYLTVRGTEQHPGTLVSILSLSGMYSRQIPLRLAGRYGIRQNTNVPDNLKNRVTFGLRLSF